MGIFWGIRGTDGRFPGIIGMLGDFFLWYNKAGIKIVGSGIVGRDDLGPPLFPCSAKRGTARRVVAPYTRAGGNDRVNPQKEVLL